MVHGACSGEEAGARNSVFFCVRVGAAGDERNLLRAAGAAAVGVPFLAALERCLQAALGVLARA
jgi:hypothetical protein